MKRVSSIFVLSLAALVAAFASGCAEGAAPSDDEVGDSTQALGQTIDVPNPSGVYFAAVTANGTGCPAGSWEAAISGDGKAFTVTFSSYEAIVEPGKSFVVKDCQIGIDLKTPGGFSFAVSAFHYSGYALLDQDGMSAKQTAKYYFMGNPVGAAEHATEMRGPYDDSFLFNNEVQTGAFVWSPCGTTRRLNAQTRLILKNNPAKTGSGYLNNTSADGEMVFTWDLAWKKC